METRTLFIIGWCGLVIGIEVIMWMLTRRKMATISFRGTGEHTTTGGFRMGGGLEIFALSHTAFLCIAIIVAHMLLW